MPELGVTQSANRIHSRLLRYLEAQYHIRETGLIDERRRLLEEPGGIAQRPYIEVTPSYSIAQSKYASLEGVPSVVGNLLDELCGWDPGVGVRPPYGHQAEALQEYIRGNDLVVATGTGSGKTEAFLYNILGKLVIEAAAHQESFQKNGVRALLLYPMNALVSDQVGRLRNFLGDERLAKLFRDRYGRNPTFGMYTSRTPYPGPRQSSRDQNDLEPILSYYDDLASSTLPQDKNLVAELRRLGRWPAKDIHGFFAKDKVENTVIGGSGPRAGTQRVLKHWGTRLFTQPGDRELLTRHEIQSTAPDLLITNYSMLEYMLLRPIERSIFDQTRVWLESNPKNQLLLILDEAHMYRGVAGAEVSLLLRRLMARLGISRNRLRCILTSASLGTDQAAEIAIQEFGNGLVGPPSNGSFHVVRGNREPRSGSKQGTAEVAKVLGDVDGIALAGADSNPGAAQQTLDLVCERLGWPLPQRIANGVLNVRQELCRRLTEFGPLEKLLEVCMGNATEFSKLAQEIFPDCEVSQAERATDGLLALGTFARRDEPSRKDLPLLPTRVHLMFRGLPSLHVCVNPNCTARRVNPGETRLLGRLFTEPRSHCECGARVFELFTHRDCGSAFIRVFYDGSTPEFLWQEDGGRLSGQGTPLKEMHVLVESPNERMGKYYESLFLDLRTGKVVGPDYPDALLLYKPTAQSRHDNETEGPETFTYCPVCCGRIKTGSRIKIMDLATKGEQPFANLVREQFGCQPGIKALSALHPNEGRKTLLFSDGRQKAARLARDLPREVEQDSIREALALSILTLENLKKPTRLDFIYRAFVSVCEKHFLSFFDGNDQRALLKESHDFRSIYGGDLEFAWADEWNPTPLESFRRAVVRQLCDPYYSLIAACAIIVLPRPQLLANIKAAFQDIPGDLLQDLAGAWLARVLEEGALDPNLSRDARQDACPYFKPLQPDFLASAIKHLALATAIPEERLTQLGTAFREDFTSEGQDGDGPVLKIETLIVRLSLDSTWFHCPNCLRIQPLTVLGACRMCGVGGQEEYPPDHPYMRSRKDFFREPLRAVLQGQRPLHVTVEEHTAQLSQRDSGVVHATTEEFELRFQDVPLKGNHPPVDVLSCTTTMEVGIDIGSLTAVGLRTVPPQRENYQQRAGRAGRRGSSVSTVLTYAQGGAHDAHYFANPHSLISGKPREPKLKSDNRTLARRHICSFLLQTFFHSQIAALDDKALAALSKQRRGILSTFGTASEFFNSDDAFSFGNFKKWISDSLLEPSSGVIAKTVEWLPIELAATESVTNDLAELARDTAKRLLLNLDVVSKTFTVTSTGSPVGGFQPPPSAEEDEDAGGLSEGELDLNIQLLDLLFDRGILPSYAFPTALCSFVIQGRKKVGSQEKLVVVERPQQGKLQALAEYAPGRQLVVNKKTYRVGGIFYGASSTNPAAEHLDGKALDRYIGCTRCSYVRLDLSKASKEPLADEPCPICTGDLKSCEFIDPPDFSPERGQPVRNGDNEQEYTYATSAQLPELLTPDQLEDGFKSAGAFLSVAFKHGVKLVVANKGRNNQGFSICQQCGAAWPDGSAPSTHRWPFLLDRRPPNQQCQGLLRNNIYLAHHFRTDVMLLRFTLGAPLRLDPTHPWLHDALATLAEALALGASRYLDIDPGELAGGYRLLRPQGNNPRQAEVFLYDTASGGAGYAADAGENLTCVLERAELLLTACEGACERSCTSCLRHYGNRFLHTRLDRSLGLQLLRFIRDGQPPSHGSLSHQADLLAPLLHYLQLSDHAGRIDIQKERAVLLLEGNPPREIRVFPALVDPACISENSSTVLVEDYLVRHDLPSAVRSSLVSSPHVTPVSVSSRCSVTIGPPKEAIQLESLLLPVNQSCCVELPPSGIRALAGSSSYITLRRSMREDRDGEVELLLRRVSGIFRATNSSCTIARCTELEDGRIQVNYGARRESNYRPERLPLAEVQILGTLTVLHKEEGS